MLVIEVVGSVRAYAGREVVRGVGDVRSKKLIFPELSPTAMNYPNEDTAITKLVWAFVYEST